MLMKSRIIERNMFYGAKGDIFEVASILRKNMTLAELVLWKKLKDRNLFKAKFRRQHPINIFIVDFYCHECKLAIEIDGEIHKNIDIKNYDTRRVSELEKYGIRILRFTNNQVLFNIEAVITNILNELNVLASF
jgi:very-short-patch-repair endonuclease